MAGALKFCALAPCAFEFFALVRCFRPWNVMEQKRACGTVAVLPAVAACRRRLRNGVESG
jgi:hypothetical protein